MFFHFLSCSSIFFICLSCSFIVFPFFSFFSSSCSSSFLGRSKSFFYLDCITISNKSSYVKNQFFGPSRGGKKHHWALCFFSVVYFFIFSFSFSFSISFQVFSFFLCFFFFSFFIPLFSCCFPFYKMFLPFSFCFSFFFSRVLNICGTLQDSLGKSAHSELALFALYWLVVTFPNGIVHILVMIRLRVACGGRRVGQVQPAYQNRQIGAPDETADAPQSSLCSLLYSLLSQ